MVRSRVVITTALFFTFLLVKPQALFLPTFSPLVPVNLTLGTSWKKINFCVVTLLPKFCLDRVWLCQISNLKLNKH